MKSQLIFILDDDDAVRNALDSCIRSLGFKVGIFYSAEKLLNSDQLDEVFCVISDVQMPGINGFELLSILQQRKPAVPVILLSAFYEDCLKNKALNMGAIEFISKPFCLSIIINALDKVT
ncbi:response regulator [Shewanella ulleungensis]|uniref:Two-component response regulator n=1 Tax=Shewanella ulleungensis TaxID=2282699 RepID=A0ABQ2QCB3_9GAMM|nr:response regulator [Shewanella ulleungensis]MCL1148860.1 response regulator [Shewanella ulleungensis]GGP75152.1 two-component response regulator [Shewanella ulleungensis]